MVLVSLVNVVAGGEGGGVPVDVEWVFSLPNVSTSVIEEILVFSEMIQ